MYFVYILFSVKDKKLYVGYTKDLKRRYQEHLIGKNISTRNRLPVKLIYYEAYLTEQEAKRREKYLKGGNGRASIKRQLDLTLIKMGYRFMD